MRFQSGKIQCWENRLKRFRLVDERFFQKRVNNFVSEQSKHCPGLVALRLIHIPAFDFCYFMHIFSLPLNM